MKRPLWCRLGHHRWSCEGQSGYWRCDGNHYCVRCGYHPKGEPHPDTDPSP